MPVFIDEKQLAMDSFGFTTVGQAIDYAQTTGRMIVTVLVDGKEPDLDDMTGLRRTPIGNKTVFIETVDAKEMAAGVIGEITEHLDQADTTRAQVADLLRKNEQKKAMEQLTTCFGTWLAAQQAVAKTAMLLKVDLDTVKLADRSFVDVMTQFSEHLRQVKSALEAKDYVLLADVLEYEMPASCADWRSAMAVLKAKIVA